MPFLTQGSPDIKVCGDKQESVVSMVSAADEADITAISLRSVSRFLQQG